MSWWEPTLRSLGYYYRYKSKFSYVPIILLIAGDWEDRKSGYYPFSETGGDDMIPEDLEGRERRSVLKNPYSKQGKDPTGVIVTSHTDKISVGPPCLIW